MKLRPALSLLSVLAACAQTPDYPVSRAPAENGFAPAALPATTAVTAPAAGAAPAADAGAPVSEPAPVAVVVPGIGEPRFAPPPASRCGSHEDTPILPEDTVSAAPADQLSKRALTDIEENGGIDKTDVEAPNDDVVLGAVIPTARMAATTTQDSDGDCLSDADEARLGTDPNNPDTDGDGWYDGPCNQRYKLVLTQVWVHDEQEDWGHDEFYLIVDDVRHPQADLDDYWSFDEGDIMNTAWPLATRTRGVDTPRLAPVTVEGWEDDWELFNTWTPDDLLFRDTVDLGAFHDGDTFTRRYIDPVSDDYDYELTFRVEIEHFADPDPLDPGDHDGDGISDANEARVAHDFGGVADPTRPDVFVEVDWMPDHALRTEAKRQVVTQYYRNGIMLHIYRNHELALDDCLTVPELRKLYADHFDYKSYGAFRYAIIGEQIWNDRSGVAWGDLFFVDDSTWWINNWVMPQAGTFIHELGHTMGLNQDMFRLIDTIAWPSYDSAMNYLYQAIKVDYSYDGAGGDTNDHDDWGVVDPAYGLKWSFALTTSTETGICN